MAVDFARTQRMNMERSLGIVHGLRDDLEMYTHFSDMGTTLVSPNVRFGTIGNPTPHALREDAK